jgi:hypothetical protein
MSAAPSLARLRRRPALAGVLCAAALLGLLTASVGSAGATTTAAGATTCPGFRVLHNDRVGPASFPAGTYTITVPASAGITCKSAGELFARFLEDYDGVLPQPWKVSAEGSGKASFAPGARAGFSVSLGTPSGGGEGGNSPILGTLCPGTFTVNSSTVVGPLRFTKGKFLIYLPPKSGITCNRASVLFTRFLGSSGGVLPSPWRLQNQTATFYKPSNPTRSAFRIEPLDGSGVR